MGVAMKTALLLIAHGSRQAEANADLFDLVAEMCQRGWPIVEGAFLELATPDVDEAGSRCVAQGANLVVLVPYFLSAGIHVRRDLGAARDRLAARHPATQFRLAEPLGPHSLLGDIVQQRARDAGA
jgi:sirohydrochlorin ferrochelatase